MNCRRAIALTAALLFLCEDGTSQAAGRPQTKDLLARIVDAQLTDKLLFEPGLTDAVVLKAFFGATKAVSVGDAMHQRVELSGFKRLRGSLTPPPESAVFERWKRPDGRVEARMELSYLRVFRRNHNLSGHQVDNALAGYTYRQLDYDQISDSPRAVQNSFGFFCPTPGTDRRVELGVETGFGSPVELRFISLHDPAFDGATPEPLGAVEVQVREGWTSPMSADDLLSYFPDRALRLKRSGRAGLTCRVAEGDHLANCSVDEETPKDFQFGVAALKWSRAVQLIRPSSDGAPPTELHINLSFALARNVGPCAAMRGEIADVKP